jgi:hypothetical protein
MSIETKGVVALFVSLAIILAINPRIIHEIYNTILGRLVLICIIVFVSMYNVTLGLLLALVIIVLSKEFGSLTEGMDNISTPYTVGEDNEDITGKQTVLTKDATKNATNNATKDKVKNKISDLKQNISELGIDKEDIRNSILPKDSKTIPVSDDATSSGEVDAFTPSMITNSSSLTEGFCPCASSV